MLVATPEDPVPTTEEPVLTPENGVTAPENEVSAPENPVQIPETEVSAPEHEIPTPMDVVSTPENEVSTPEKPVPTPENGVSIPLNEVSTPENEVSIPLNEVSTPENEVSTPMNGVSAPEKPVPMSNPIDVEELLESAARSIQVEKELPLTLDLGSITAYDMTPVETSQLGQGKARDLYLKELTRQNTQLLFNSIFSLPTTHVERTKCVQLPSPTCRLPREKPIPKPQLPTKWEAFAKSKGIQKKKRGRMIYDEVAKEWKPRFGYNKAGSDKEQNWVVEVPGNGDPYKDWLGEKEDKKKENVAKNELKRLQNISKQVKVKSEAISQTVKQAHKSTASLGKFQDKVKNEKKAKLKGKQKKFEAVTGNAVSEKENSLAIIEKIASSKTVSVNKDKAGKQELGATIKRKREEEVEKKQAKRRSKMGVKAQTKHFDKKKRQVSGPDRGKSKR